MTSEKFSICSEIGIPEYIESARNAVNQTCAFCTKLLNVRIFFRILFFILKQFVEGKNLMLKIHAHVFCISKIRMHFFCDSSCKNDCEIKKRRRKTAYRNSGCFF